MTIGEDLRATRSGFGCSGIGFHVVGGSGFEAMRTVVVVMGTNTEYQNIECTKLLKEKAAMVHFDNLVVYRRVFILGHFISVNIVDSTYDADVDVMRSISTI